MEPQIESVLKKIDELYAKSAKGPLSKMEGSGDGKRQFMTTPDGWEDLRLEVDTDDCDSAVAKDSANCLRLIWNNWDKIRPLISGN